MIHYWHKQQLGPVTGQHPFLLGCHSNIGLTIPCLRQIIIFQTHFPGKAIAVLPGRSDIFIICLVQYMQLY